MAISSIQTACQALAQNIREDYPNLTLGILAIKNDGFKLFTPDVKKHPAYKTVMKALKNEKKKITEPVTFFGLTRTKTKSPIPVFKIFQKEKTFALLVLNIEQIDMENEQEDIKTLLYKNVFKALKTLDDSKEQTDPNQIHHYAPAASEHIKYAIAEDAFVAFMNEIRNQNDSIKQHAKRICKNCFKQNVFMNARNAAYPIALDVISLVYADFQDYLSTQDKPFKSAYMMAEEARLSCPDQLIRQWQAFMDLAQEMVWANVDIKYILGAAIYTSENSYNRSVGYIIAEIMDTDPAPITNWEGYNAFTDLDIQDRTHNKICNEIVKLLLEGLEAHDAPNKFLNRAYTQSLECLKGNIVGYCAPVLAKLAFEALDHNKTITTEDIEDALKQWTWMHCRTLHRGIMHLKQNGQTPNLDSLVELLRQDEELRRYAIFMKRLKEDFQP